MRRAVLVLMTALLLLTASPASATDGSVPKVVADYISTDLVDALAEFYGPGADGDGTLFDASTTYSATSRVWAWTPEFEAGIADEPAERRLNEWVTVVSVGEVVVGVATVSIDPVTGGPQLANFLASPELAAAISGVGATSMLLRDVEREAWLAVEGDSVSPVVAGLSGLSAPSTVAAYRARIVVAQPGGQPAVAQPVAADGVLIVGLAAGLVVVLLALERFWRRRGPELAKDPEDHVL